MHLTRNERPERPFPDVAPVFHFQAYILCAARAAYRVISSISCPTHSVHDCEGTAIERGRRVSRPLRGKLLLQRHAEGMRVPCRTTRGVRSEYFRPNTLLSRSGLCHRRLISTPSKLHLDSSPEQQKRPLVNEKADRRQLSACSRIPWCTCPSAWIAAEKV